MPSRKAWVVVTATGARVTEFFEDEASAVWWIHYTNRGVRARERYGPLFVVPVVLQPWQRSPHDLTPLSMRGLVAVFDSLRDVPPSVRSLQESGDLILCRLDS